MKRQNEDTFADPSITETLKEDFSFIEKSFHLFSISSAFIVQYVIPYRVTEALDLAAELITELVRIPEELIVEGAVYVWRTDRFQTLISWNRSLERRYQLILLAMYEPEWNLG